MESDSSSDVVRSALERFYDPIIVVHPDRWEEWSEEEIDIFLNSDMRPTQVIVAERDIWIRTLIGELDV